MKKFPTPRLLLEVRSEGTWKAVKIFCDYHTVRHLCSDLPSLALAYDVDLNDMRIKNLQSDQAIADAKQLVYDNTRRKTC